MDTETVKVLMEAGYVAAGTGRFKEAWTIFAGVLAARPESKFPAIGMAVTLMNAGEHEDAVKLLKENISEDNSSGCLLKSFLGLALLLAGHSAEAGNTLNDVVQGCSDETEAFNMAKALLTEL